MLCFMPLRLVCMCAQSCLTLQPHGLQLGSSVHGIFQAGKLEWDAIFSSKGSSQPRDQILVSWQVDSLPLSYLGSLKANMP